jgi:murein DD-endopeptidase MepM/ murein hydrolase activator NlpD
MIYYRPVKSQWITQWFGENKNSFYAELNMEGHNGIDFGVPTGTSVFWYGSEGATVLMTGVDYYGGNALVLLTEEDEKHYSHTFYHLKEFKVQAGDVIKPGQLIAISDNTGKASTGSHLHALEVKEVEKDQYGNWRTINKDNGYLGAINPMPKFKNIFILEYLQITTLQLIIEALKRFLKGR